MTLGQVSSIQEGLDFLLLWLCRNSKIMPHLTPPPAFANLFLLHRMQLITMLHTACFLGQVSLWYLSLELTFSIFWKMPSTTTLRCPLTYSQLCSSWSLVSITHTEILSLCYVASTAPFSFYYSASSPSSGSMPIAADWIEATFNIFKINSACAFLCCRKLKYNLRKSGSFIRQQHLANPL